MMCKVCITDRWPNGKIFVCLICGKACDPTTDPWTHWRYSLGWVHSKASPLLKSRSSYTPRISKR